VEWHLRQAWAGLFYADEEGSPAGHPVPLRPTQGIRQAQEEARPHLGRPSPPVFQRPSEEP